VPESASSLTTAIASGDTEALARFYERYFDFILREARSVSGGDEAVGLDVVQDTMLRVVRSLRPLESEEHLRRWLRVVVRHVARDRLRAETRRRRRERATADEVIVAHAERTDDRLAWLQREIDAMSDAEQRLLVDRFGFGRTLRSIGESVGLSPGAVDGRIGRLLNTLRRRAGETFHDA
jgi:RNA polymerase sigma-70 factor (ECF subfamily)